ncbi:Hypothetical predicted protein [Podarcis lilfordi]|uniref:Uncharacterized protein n=1 Tax=Podarcis lilfordi TaxID=74358 RepID=A0AA35PCE7_9SAUR|nr:Hypothetical predicted protein [Podarcis lilfordi]
MDLHNRALYLLGSFYYGEHEMVSQRTTSAEIRNGRTLRGRDCCLWHWRPCSPSRNVSGAFVRAKLSRMCFKQHMSAVGCSSVESYTYKYMFLVDKVVYSAWPLVTAEIIHCCLFGCRETSCQTEKTGI